MSSAAKEWPDAPYKGLTYYDVEDRPIFTGRESEIEGVSHLLDEGQTRILLLHGETGCGKSSFLRAGLIPYLEEFRFKFLHQESADDAQRVPVFITASEKPLVKLSNAIYEHLASEERTKLPEELQNLTADEFANEVGTSPKKMIQVLKDIASRSPKTLVLIIDQAEEVMTLWPENSEDEPKVSFFEFLFIFSSKQINVKLILSLRTEYYGKFISGIHSYTFNMSGFRDYYLQPITDKELKDAIVLPTKDEPVGGYGKPRDKYRFSYEEGLVETIARDLNTGSIIGSRLAVMQVICKRLYETTAAKALKKKGREWTIKCSDYTALGKIPDQLNAYVDETLTDKIKEDGLGDDIRRLEVNRWKNVLYRLVDSHEDGRVTKRYESENELIRMARDFQSSLDPKDTLEFLSGSTRQILRREVQTVTVHAIPRENKTGDEELIQYTLAHDAIGLALKAWKSLYDGISAGRKHRIVYNPSERDDFILRAANYSGEQLFDMEYRPKTSRLSAVNDNLWDHQILTFAQHKKFFKRLGIDLSFSNIRLDVGKGSHHRIETMLTAHSQASVLVAYPKSLIGEGAFQFSLDFAISNVFTGYAIISRQSLKRCFEWDKPLESSVQTFAELARLRIAAEDEGASKFVETLRELSELAKSVVEGPTSALSSAPVEPITLCGREELFRGLERGEIDVLVLTAPSRGYATQAGYPIFFDSNDALRLLERIGDQKLDGPRREKLKELDRQLILHNCWNINVGENNWEDNKELRELILRLASVALFTSTYIRRDQEEVTGYLQKLNSAWIAPLNLDVMRDTFEYCYDFSLNESYFDSYLDKSSKYYYDPNSTSVSKSAVLSNPHKVYKLMMGLRQKYYELSEQFDIHASPHTDSDSQGKAQRLKEQARRHYHIFNYIDAVSILERACEMQSNGKH
jgi:hypothetical protein